MEKYAEQTKQEFEGWEEFISKPVDEKLEAFKRKDASLTSFMPSSLIENSWTLCVIWPT